MSTAVLPRNWLRLICPPIVLGSVKSGACSPISRAVATGAALSIPASSTPNHKTFFMRFVPLPIGPSPPCKGPRLHNLRHRFLHVLSTWLLGSLPAAMLPPPRRLGTDGGR